MTVAAAVSIALKSVWATNGRSELLNISATFGGSNEGPVMATRRIRVIDLETPGDAATDVWEIGWQDVVSIDGAEWALNDERSALFVNPGRPISAETMSIHHIRDEDVSDAPFWRGRT